jgi:hypothetical protein
MDDAGTLTTLTLTHRERMAIAASLTLSATMMDALDDVDGAREALVLWERVCPDWAGE